MADITQWDIEQWVKEVANGEFHYKEVLGGNIDPASYGNLRKIMSTLCHAKEPICETIGRRDGWYRPIENGVHPLDFTVTQEVKDFPIILPFDLRKYVFIYPDNTIIVAGSKSSGKGHPYGTPILTPQGFKPIEKLTVGDYIYSQNGKQTKIEGKFERGEQECYRFVFNDKTWIEVDSDHLWKFLSYARYGKIGGHGKPSQVYKEWQVLSTADIVKRFGQGKLAEHSRLLIPKVEPIQFPSQLVPIDGYLLGVLLGDGSLRARSSISLSTSDSEILSPFGKSVRPDGGYNYRILGMTRVMDKLGLRGKRSNEKFVPSQYLWNDVETRLAVLQGLLDTDGYIDKKGAIEFCSTSSQLSKDVRFLVASLGGRTTVRTKQPYYTYKGEKKKGKLCYIVAIKIDTVCPFRLTRKIERLPVSWHTCNRIIHEIIPVGKKETICLKVADSSGLYVAKDFIVTHNTGFLYQVIKLNHKKENVVLLTNMEGGQDQMYDRFLTMGLDLAVLPKFIYPVYDNYHDYIKKRDTIYVIDYIDAPEGTDFYLIGAAVSRVNKKLQGLNSVAVIGLQKPSSRDTAFGGDQTLKVATLYIAMDNNKLKIVDAKVPADKKLHPRNMQWTFVYDADGMDFLNIVRSYGNE